MLSSPPYADQMSAARARGRGPKGDKIIAEKKIEHNKMGDGPDQIGNLHDQTYLAAMLQVYRELYCVLRPYGVVALVTKNPVKKGQIRRLDLDTIKLMQASGFTLLEHKKAMLAEETFHGHLFEGETRTKRERKSFFKRLFEKKNPHLAVDFEDVLFFKKTENALPL